MGNDAFYAVVPAGAAFFTDAKLSRRQTDIVVNDNELRCLVNFIEVRQRPDALAA